MGRASNLRWWVLPPAVAAYLVAALWPFRFDLPSRTENGLQRTDAGVLVFDGSSLATTEDEVARFGMLGERDTISVTLLARTEDRSQDGPARLLTVSSDEHHRDLAIAQDGDDLHLRVRRPGADDNGDPPLVVPDVFTTAAWRDIEVTIADAVRVSIDGDVRLLHPLPDGVFARWVPFPVTLGNERTGTRGWRGELRRAEVRWPEGRVDYATEPLEVPSSWWTTPEVTVGTRSDAKDVVLNLLGFVPIGVLLAVLGRRPVLWAAAGSVGVSVLMEAGQVLTVSRHTSVVDLFVNGVGGALGGVLLVVGRSLSARGRRRGSSPAGR